MSSDWQVKKLGEHCIKIGSGATPKGGKEVYLDNGQYRLIRSQNIFNEGFNPSGLAYIDADQAKKLDGVAVVAGDVLLNITGDSVARVCLAPEKYIPARVNQHVAIIRPKPDVFDSRYVRYFLASKQQQNFMLGLAAAGATRNALTKGMIESFEIPSPPIEIQHSIAEILGSLEDRIALLRETNKTLEALSQAIFKSWFIDFDPVRAKMEGRTPVGLDEKIAALFPDELVQSELGLIPRGWGCMDLADVSSYLSRGLSPKYTEVGGILVLNQKCVRDFAVDYTKGRRHDLIKRKVDGRLLEIGDVLVNSTGVGTLGRLAQILSLDEPVIVDSHLTVVRAGQKVSWPYLGECMKKMQPTIESMGEGSTGQTELSRGKLEV